MLLRFKKYCLRLLHQPQGNVVHDGIIRVKGKGRPLIGLDRVFPGKYLRMLLQSIDSGTTASEIFPRGTGFCLRIRDTRITVEIDLNFPFSRCGKCVRNFSFNRLLVQRMLRTDQILKSIAADVEGIAVSGFYHGRLFPQHPVFRVALFIKFLEGPVQQIRCAYFQ